MKERKFFELSFSKKIMVILVGLLFTVIFNNHHAVYAVNYIRIFHWMIMILKPNAK